MSYSIASAGRHAPAMLSLIIAVTQAHAAFDTDAADSDADSGGSRSSAALDEVVVIAERLNEAPNGIQTQTGASTYTINEAAIGAQPGGDNQLLNQVIMQAPDVAQDSF